MLQVRRSDVPKLLADVDYGLTKIINRQAFGFK